MADRPPLIPEEIAQRTFATSFRGFDPAEVRAFLGRLADQLRGIDARQAELSTRLAAAEERVKHPQLDIETLTTALGEETARILRSAQDAAQDIRAKAEENVAHLLREAYEEASRIRADAEVVLARETDAAETVASGIRASAENDAAAALHRARQEAERLLGEVEVQAHSMVEEARTTRARVLADLARRRRLGHTQVEQLRAGRERLLEAYRLVRTTLDEVTEELLRAESEARNAAEVAARRTAEAAFEEVEPAPDGEEVRVSGTEPASAVGAELASDTEPAAAEEAVSELPPEAGPEPQPDAEEPRLSSVRILRRPRTPDAPGPTPKPEPVLRPKPESKSGTEPESKSEPKQGFAPAPPPPDGTEGVRLLRPRPEPERPRPEPERVDRPEPARGLERVPEPAAVAAPAAVSSAVDELFARLRADRTAEPPVVAEEPTAGPAEAAGVPADESPVSDAESPVPDEDEALLQRRDTAVEDVQHRLARRLKRALQDEQNDVLDRLRVLRDRPRADVLLPPADDHPARYRDEAAALLAEAAEAGAKFVDLSPGAVSVDDLAASLATDVVDPLRRRLERSLEEGADEDQPLVVERIGAAYREVKGRRIEQLAADHVVAAFSRGAVTATPEGAAFRWVVDDEGGPCPDCDDNALAGPTPRGEAFPTGQSHPPAHAGCRCLLVPATP